MAKTRTRKTKKKVAKPIYRIFVDYENAPDCLPLVEEYDHEEVWIFVGRQQKKIPLEMVQRMQGLGSDVHWVSPGAVGKNALDFILAMNIGIHHAEAPEHVHFAILSADKGYDPLIGELEKAGRTVIRVDPVRSGTTRAKKAKVTRATTATTATTAPARKKKKKKRATGQAESIASLTEMVADRLDRMSDARLPTRKKGLLKHVESQLPSDAKDKAEAVVNGLRRRKIVKITRAGIIEYL